MMASLKLGPRFLGTFFPPAIVLTAFFLAPLFSPRTAAASPPAAELRRAQRELERSPQDPDTLRLVLDLSREAGGVKALLDHYRDRAQQRPKDGKAALVWAQLLRVSGDCDAAIKAYDQAAGLLPKASAPFAGKARCHALGEHWPAAVSAWQEAAARVGRGRRAVEIYEALINAALRAEREDVASQAWEKLSALQPSDPRVRITYARALESAGRVQLAAQIWRAVRRLARNDQKTRVLAAKELGRLLGRLGKTAEAIAIYRAEIKRLPAEHWATLELQEGLIAAYRQEGRIPEYIAALKRRRGSYPALLLMARLYEETGDDTRALAAYRKAVRQRPSNVDARAALLRILGRSGSKDALIAEYRGLIKKVPGEPRYALELAELYLNRGDKDAAFRVLDTVSRKFGDDPGVHESVVDLFIRFDADRARVEREFRRLMRLEPDEDSHIIQLGEYFFAEDDRGQAVQTWNRLPTVLRDKGKAHLLLAGIFADHDMQDDALEHFKQAIALAPRSTRAYRAQGIFLEKISRFGDAAESFSHVLSLLPNDNYEAIREARQRVVRLRGRQAGPGRLLAALKARVEGPDAPVETLLRLGEALILEHEFEPAAEIFERVTKAHPKDVQALLALEEVYNKLNRLRDTIEVLQRLADVAPSLADEKLGRIADLSLELGSTAEALKYARLVVTLRPTDPAAQTHLGDVLLQLRRYEAALSAYRRSLRLNPGAYRVQFKLAAVLERLDRPHELAAVLTGIVKTAKDPNDILNAGRRLLQSADLPTLQDFEPVLLNAVFRRARRATYRKLLVDLYAAMVKRARLDAVFAGGNATASSPLARIGAQGLKALLDALADTDLAVRTRVLRILISARPRRAVLPVVRLLDEKDRVLRFQALVALAHLGSEASEPAIERLLEARQGNVGIGAIWALGMVPGRRAGKALTGLPGATRRRSDIPMWRALALGIRGQASGFEPALRLFRETNKALRPYGAWALGAIGEARAVGPLLRALPLAPLKTQRVIVWALGAIGDRKATEALIRVVWGADPELRPMARWALGRLQSGQRLDRAALRERYLALHDFERARLDLRRALPSLAQPDGPTRVDGEALLKRAGPLLKKTLLKQLASSDPKVAVRVLEALQGPTGLVLGGLAPTTSIPQAWHPAILKAARRLATAREVGVRRAAVGVLARLGDLDGLRTALSDPAASVRVDAAAGLTLNPSPAALTALLDALGNGRLGQRWVGRAAAGDTLAVLLAEVPGASARALPLLRPLLNDEFPSVRERALRAAQAMGPRAAALTDAVIARLKDAHPEVALQAIETLGALGDPKARAPLERLKSHANPAVRDATQQALRRLL